MPSVSPHDVDDDDSDDDDGDDGAGSAGNDANVEIPVMATATHIVWCTFAKWFSNF